MKTKFNLSLAFGPSSVKTIQIVPKNCCLDVLRGKYGYDSTVTVSNLNVTLDGKTVMELAIAEGYESAELTKRKHLLDMSLVKRCMIDVIESALA